MHFIFFSPLFRPNQNSVTHTYEPQYVQGESYPIRFYYKNLSNPMCSCPNIIFNFMYTLMGCCSISVSS